MAVPVISAEKEKISSNESASYSIEDDFNGIQMDRLQEP
jgi:hypothetical protein